MPTDVLIVEDNQGDVRLIREAFRALDQTCNLTVVPNGDEAIDTLRRNTYSFVLLDLLLPGTDGFDVIRFIKSRPSLMRTVIIVLTGVASPTVIQRAYEAGANCCLIKPHDFDELQSLLNSTISFWTQIARAQPANSDQQANGRERAAARSA